MTFMRGASWLLLIASMALSGCSSEPYAACGIPRSALLDEGCRGQEKVQHGQETSSSATCVVDSVFECDSQLCATFDDEDAFCTEVCGDINGDGKISDDEHAVCPQDGFCTEFVAGTGEYFCLPDALAREKNLR